MRFSRDRERDRTRAARNRLIAVALRSRRREKPLERRQPVTVACADVDLQLRADVPNASCTSIAADAHSFVEHVAVAREPGFVGADRKAPRQQARTDTTHLVVSPSEPERPFARGVLLIAESERRYGAGVAAAAIARF